MSIFIVKKHLLSSHDSIHFLSHVACHTAAFCPQLDSPTNGRVLVTGLGVQEQAIYVCDPGFVIVGLLVRICLDNGEWGGDDPTCTSEQHDRHYMQGEALNGRGGGGGGGVPRNPLFLKP